MALIVLTNDFSLPVSTTFLRCAPGGPLDPARLTEQFSLRLGPAVGGFLLISAVFHFLVAAPCGYPRYRAELDGARNRVRWVSTRSRPRS